MANAKTPSAKASKQAPTISTAALMHGADAFGARFVKPGFAFTPEDDLAFALGYPHLTYIADGHPDDENPEQAAPIYVSKHGLMPAAWPREVAHRVARGFGLWYSDEKLAAAYGTGGPVSEDEARALVRRELCENNSWILILLLEALVGPIPVLETVVEQLEAYSTQEWTDTGMENRLYLDTTLLWLGYPLLRLPGDRATALRARLEALHAEWSAHPQPHRDATTAALDVVLHCAAGADRSAYRVQGKVSVFSRLHVLDDSAWVARAAQASGGPDSGCNPDPRLVFLGGEPVLDLELSWWKKYTNAGSHALLVERFGKIQSPKLLPWMLEMSATSKAKASAQAWFVKHADFARSFLEKTAAAGGAPADWAKPLLKKLG